MPLEESGIHQALQHDFNASFAEAHHRFRLPVMFAKLPNGHFGSHQFVVDDFMKAVRTGTLPPNHTWRAADYVLPGLIAHESSKREGELLSVPDMGQPPADWALLEPDSFVAYR